LVLCCSSTLNQPWWQGRVRVAARCVAPPSWPAVVAGGGRGGRSSAAPLVVFSGWYNSLGRRILLLGLLWALAHRLSQGSWSLQRAWWSGSFLELLPGGLRRFASVSPSGLNGVGHPSICFDAPQVFACHAAPSGSAPRQWCGGRREATSSVA
jgi:hypothetical protein